MPPSAAGRRSNKNDSDDNQQHVPRKQGAAACIWRRGDVRPWHSGDAPLRHWAKRSPKEVVSIADAVLMSLGLPLGGDDETEGDEEKTHRRGVTLRTEIRRWGRRCGLGYRRQGLCRRGGATQQYLGEDLQAADGRPAWRPGIIMTLTPGTVTVTKRRIRPAQIDSAASYGTVHSPEADKYRVM